MALWAKVDPALDPASWLQRCIAEGVAFQDGQRFDFHKRLIPYIRLGFASSTESELDTAVTRMQRALKRASQRRSAARGRSP